MARRWASYRWACSGSTLGGAGTGGTGGVLTGQGGAIGWRRTEARGSQLPSCLRDLPRAVRAAGGVRGPGRADRLG